ncbi:unnamed protein product [Auanema sp. JU1783]|nr:unnamed protein product [Auanema sp. JU1783]
MVDVVISAGHDVTVLMPLPDEKTKKLVSAKAKTITVELPPSIKQRFATRTRGFWEANAFFGNLKSLHNVSSIQLAFCEYLLENQNLFMDKLNDDYDVAVMDVSAFCSFGLFQKLKVKNFVITSAIGFLSTYSNDFQAPLVYSHMPASLLYFTDRMSFTERLINILWHTGSSLTFKFAFLSGYIKLFAKHGINFDLNRDINARTNYYLMNSLETLDYARAASSKIKYIGGIAASTSETMPEEFEKILSKAKKGVIVISFGSVASTSEMLPDMREAVFKAIRAYPEYTFVWRVDQSDMKLSEKFSNLKTVAWLPQKQLLNDLRVKLFISHAGMNSLIETALSGKACIWVPIFADQFQNAGMMARFNSSKILWKTDLKGDNVINTIKEMLGTDSYARNGNRLSGLIKSQKMTAKDTLLEAIERTAHFGKIESIDLAGYDLNFFQYYSLDILIFILSLAWALFKITKMISKMIFSMIFEKKTKVKKQ